MQHDAETIDEVCELIFEAITEYGAKYMVAGDIQFDMQTRVVYVAFSVSQSLMPDHLKQRITEDVERQVCAFFGDMDVVSKVGVDPKWGRCFIMNLPPELRGMSWDQFRNRRPSSNI